MTSNLFPYALKTDAGLYYTGKSGEAYVSADKDEAFGFGPTMEAAERRCANLNRMAAITGNRFSVVTL